MTASEEAGLGTLIQRSDLPTSAGMDALESRLVVVQEVPPKAEVRFYAVRGDYYEQLTNDAVRTVLREHVPRKAITELSETERLIEVSVLRAEVDHMRPIYLAAKVWRDNPHDRDEMLTAAIDAAAGKDHER